MQSNYQRFLGPVFKRARLLTSRLEATRRQINIGGKEGVHTFLSEAALTEQPVSIPPEFNAKDYFTFLLYIDAEIEHGLMLQYLYAAYSLGGPQIPETGDFRTRVRTWQETILGIAKEEMGHFISVQNILKLIGAPLHFDRQDYPWDTPFYPFPFKLEPLTLDSLAKYVYAEAPQEWIDSDDRWAKEIKQKVEGSVPNPHTVGALFDVLKQLVQDTDRIGDEVFQANTYPFQGKFDEWGRGYQGGARGNTLHGSPTGTPDVLVMPLASRDDAQNALESIAEQGEDTTQGTENPSHFTRFLLIYQDMTDMINTAGSAWAPARNVAVNPYIKEGDEDGDSDPSGGQVAGNDERDAITDPRTINWAHLFNLRYRLLLNFLNHSFVLEEGLNTAGATTPRGLIINSTFGEMYNLRSIAGVLVQLPLGDGSQKTAGAPFLIPYTLQLPVGEHNRWRTHADVIEASTALITQMLNDPQETNQQYLKGLREADAQLTDIINEMLQVKAC
ncbi:ferritin-like protein [Chitinophaga sp. 30R24]|uniref:ferritin-like domain-containing protein n=1 Tax=Chitinophaga sp. 30R24 TaxID=3248838 RepID=UPI003B902FDF